MDDRYFRYQYENTEDGIIQSGSIWDKAYGKKTNYLYLAGEYTKASKSNKQDEGGIKIIVPESTLDIFVLGGYTRSYLQTLIDILQENKVKTVIMPYIAPMIRFDMISCFEELGGMSEKLKSFIGAPYSFLKKERVENVYLIYGNGEILSEKPEELKAGHYFERVDERIQNEITKMEGIYIPIYQAGYIVENRWLFYFGFYGTNYQIGATRRLWVSITMFVGPIGVKSKETDCMFTTKAFTRSQRCSIQIPKQYDSCALRCLYRNDYDTIKKHMDANHENLRVGLLNLGNINLRVDLHAIITRYGIVLDQIRGISVPNCGNIEWWNKKVISFFTGMDLVYYICNISPNTDAEVIKDIVSTSSFNRFINVNEEFAYCFSGFLILKEED